MKRVDGVVGNVESDPDLAAEIDAHEQADTLETVVLDDTERKRSRLRVTTDAGTDLGVLVDQPELVAGDVLLLDEERAVVVAFEEREAFVIEFSAAEAAVSTGVELGHRIGNQHWDIAVDGATIYIPVEADRAIIEDVLGPYIPESATTRYETVDAERFIAGDADTAVADHGVDHDHDHGDDAHNHGDDAHDHGDESDDHGDDHSHTHDHEHEHSHEHGHSHDDTHDHDHADSATATASEGEPR
ncbi:urease accessory protein UreE [Halonotius roseus]|uniref:Urease accessory protein UreE n=1 Tax=Halonotius roseus TaxID=2511997 RepID=A0A544QMN9_9EURY|nr:urease accessory protein UreE [Halonotius roseus]TQQ80134.1 urease accessory protein UreE [Halonotius roseus]